VTLDVPTDNILCSSVPEWDCSHTVVDQRKECFLYLTFTQSCSNITTSFLLLNVLFTHPV